tara:strand:+ start:720 stop:1736 length:1017 start_codon:yes stop_codon:yes gene_type:complete
MKNNNFDDFLLDPSHDDLDALHNEAERQLLRPGGFLNKLRKKVKTKLTDKRNKKNSSKKVSNAQAAEINNVGNSNPTGSKSTTAKTAPVKKADPVKKRVDTSATDPKINVKKKPLVVKKTNAPLKTKRNTGKSYKMAWDGMSAAKKAKYKGGYSDFETQAKDYNKTKDAKKRADAGTKAHEGRSEKFKKQLNTDAAKMKKDSNKAKVIKGFTSGSTVVKAQKERGAAEKKSRDDERITRSLASATGVRPRNSKELDTGRWDNERPNSKGAEGYRNYLEGATNGGRQDISDADKKNNAEIKKKKAESAAKAKKASAEKKAKQALKDKTVMRPKGYGPSY